MSARPAVVLIHGAFADASGWAGIAAELAGDDVDVVAPPNHLRGVSFDAAYVSSVLDQIDGPVVLVGHSYGGAVITTAGNHEKVAALVYVAGYALDEGETLGELQSRFPDPPLTTNLRYAPFPVEGGEPGTDVSIDPDAFPHIFAADVPIETTRFMARSQRPLSAAAFTEPSGPPAWRGEADLGHRLRRGHRDQPGRRALRLRARGDDGDRGRRAPPRGLHLAARRGRRGHPRGGRDRGPGRVERTASGPAKVDADGRARARRP